MFQLGSALLDGCVLAVLAREDAYGYSLTQGIKQVIPVSESTLYPVLRRLQNERLLGTYDQPHSGRNRRYYRITEDGMKRLHDTQNAWATFKTSVDSLLLQDVTSPEAKSTEEKDTKKDTKTKAKTETKAQKETTNKKETTKKGGEEK